MTDQIIIYLIRSGICLFVFYMIYFLFFRRETFFHVSRFYLLGASFLALVIPLINISLPWSDENLVYYYVMETITITSGLVEETINSHIGVFEAVLIIYLTGFVLFTFRFLFQILQLLLLIKKYGIDHKEGMRLVFIDKHISPFSFFNIIFINKELLTEKNREEIIVHESIHIKQKHTLDLLMLELLTIVQWFNPIIWFYRNSIKSIHEFLADEGVLLKGYDGSIYRNLILNLSTGIQVNGLTNNFNHSLLKRRIIMMTKTKTKGKVGWRLFMAFPIALVMAFVFSLTFSNLAIAQVDEDIPPPPPPKKTEEVKVTDAPPPPAAVSDVKSQNEEIIYKEVDQPPKFKGGQEGLGKFYQENIVYPEKARNEGIMGTVYVAFIIDKKGNVIDPKVKKGIGGGCDEEALRAVKIMPPWEPGKVDGKPVKVAMVLPIKFWLDDGEKKSEKQ